MKYFVTEMCFLSSREGGGAGFGTTQNFEMELLPYFLRYCFKIFSNERLSIYNREKNNSSPAGQFFNQTANFAARSNKKLNMGFSAPSDDEYENDIGDESNFSDDLYNEYTKSPSPWTTHSTPKKTKHKKYLKTESQFD